MEAVDRAEVARAWPSRDLEGGGHQGSAHRTERAFQGKEVNLRLRLARPAHAGRAKRKRRFRHRNGTSLNRYGTPRSTIRPGVRYTNVHSASFLLTLGMANAYCNLAWRLVSSSTVSFSSGDQV